MGLIFEMPILIFFLALMGIITAGFMLKNFRYAILLIFIIAAIVTPTPDILSMCIFAAPMVGLYGISIGIACVVHPKQRQAREEKRENKSSMTYEGFHLIEKFLLPFILLSFAFTACDRDTAAAHDQNSGLQTPADSSVAKISFPADQGPLPTVDAVRAMQYVKEIVAFGPRPLRQRQSQESRRLSSRPPQKRRGGKG